MQLNISPQATSNFVWYIRAFNPSVKRSSKVFKVIARTEEHAVARLTARLSGKNIMWPRSNWKVTSIKQGKEVEQNAIG